MTSDQIQFSTIINFNGKNPKPIFSLDLILTLVDILETDKRKNLFHSLRVAVLSYFIGAEINLPFPDLKELFLAALLHDIGGVAVDKFIPEKLAELPDVFGQHISYYLFAHPARGYNLLKQFPSFRKMSETVYCHHEFFDGSGYPRGLKQNEIPLQSKIIRIADSAEILLRLHQIKTFEELESFLSLTAGEEFDPDIYETFINVVSSTNIIECIYSEEGLKELIIKIKSEINTTEYLSTTESIDRFLEIIANIIDNITSQNKSHSTKVAEFAEQIAIGLNLSEGEIKQLKWAAYLHDIGKLITDRTIYFKKEKLVDEDWLEIRSQPQLSFEILKSIDDLQNIAHYILYHHENFDGSGYPGKLKGNKIPLTSRILRIAEAFEAMTSERVYQRKKDWQKALRELRKYAGKHFDPELVEITLTQLELN